MTVTGETTTATTSFGSVSNRRVLLTERGTSVDLSLSHITAISSRIDRHPYIGVVFVLAAPFLPFRMDPAWGGIVLGLCSLAIGLYLVSGWPMIQIQTADGKERSITGRPWQKHDAEAFAGAIREQLFGSKSASQSS